MAEQQQQQQQQQHHQHHKGQQQQASRKKTCAPTSSSKPHFRPWIPLQFNAKQAEVVLADICPHRKKFADCERYLCTVAYEKYQWLELLREKSRSAMKILEDADQLLRSQLLDTFNASLEALIMKQGEELEAVAKTLSRKTAKLKLIDENVKYVKFYDLDKKDPIECDCPLGYTKDHVDFLLHQHDVMKERNYINKKTTLDLKKYEHSQEIIKFKESISTPTSFLDRLLAQHQETIQFHSSRVEKLILYILKLCVVPRTFSPEPSQTDDPLLVGRVKKASSQAFQLLKASLIAFSKLCEDIRKTYCNAEDEIQLLMNKSSQNARSSPTSPEQSYCGSAEFDAASEAPPSHSSETDYSQLQMENIEEIQDREDEVGADTTIKPKVRHSKSPQIKLRKGKSKLFLGDHKVIARMSDTRLNDKALLTSIIARSKAQPNDLATSGSIPDQTDNTLQWNPKPCCFCGKKFRGSGKLSPSIVNRDADVRSRAKQAVKKDKSLYPDFEKKVTLGDDYKGKKKNLLADLEKSADTECSNNAFCSWVCVKRWTVTCCPMQYKYQSEMLIDMVAGYAVQI